MMNNRHLWCGVDCWEARKLRKKLVRCIYAKLSYTSKEIFRFQDLKTNHFGLNYLKNLNCLNLDLINSDMSYYPYVLLISEFLKCLIKKMA